MGETFFERFSKLAKERGETPNSVAREIGASSGSVTAWKRGTEPRNATLAKIADYLGTTTDYLTGRTDDPINYDDGDFLANIPDSYLKAFDGDARKAYSAMKEVDKDNKTPPSTEEQQGRNVIKIAGRNGVYRERILSDSQLAALESILDQLPDASDDL